MSADWTGPNGDPHDRIRRDMDRRFLTWLRSATLTELVQAAPGFIASAAPAWRRIAYQRMLQQRDRDGYRNSNLVQALVEGVDRTTWDGEE